MRNDPELFDSFKTGDLLLNSSTGAFATVVQYVTFSDYNHSTVTVRIDMSYLPKIKIVREGGKLFLIELIKDIKFPKLILWESQYINKKVERFPLKDKYYTKEFEQNLTHFLNIHCVLLRFINKPDIYVEKNPESSQLKHKFQLRRNNLPTAICSICSELTASIYLTCLPEETKNRKYEPYLYLPRTYSNKKHRFNHLFEQGIIVYSNNINNNYSITLILLFLFILLLIFLVLYKSVTFTKILISLLILFICFTIFYKTRNNQS